MNEKVKSTLQVIMQKFEDGTIPEPIAISLFPVIDVPCGKWSLLNRTLMSFHSTADARGFRQWQSVNRFVKKGATALYILVPVIKKKKDDSGEDKHLLCGFKPAPVFKVEDTDGEPLEYENFELPALPLIERAEEWGISVKAIPGNYSYYGYFSRTNNEICLAAPDELTFFHELSHASHSRIIDLKAGQDPIQEIVAELSAQVLCHLVGKVGDKTLGNSYRYIKSYAEKLEITPAMACLRVISETEKVLALIINGGVE